MIILNGKLRETSDFQWDKDSGFRYGYGGFETIHFYNNRPLFLDHHKNRLSHTLKALEIPKPNSMHKWQDNIQLLAKHHQLSHGIIRIYITGGPQTISTEATKSSTEIITISPMPKVQAPRSFTWKPIQANSWFALKSMTYAHHLIHTKTHWPIYIDANQHIIDGSIFSLAYIEQDTIISIEHPYQVQSISKKILETLTPMQSKQVKQHEIQVNQIFGCNVIRGVFPLFFENEEQTIHPKIQELSNSWDLMIKDI